MINFKWVFQKNDNISIIKDFRSKMGETQFQTNFVQMGVSKTLTSLVYQGFWIQNGGNSISDQFCPNGFFKNSYSISGILDPKWGETQFQTNFVQMDFKYFKNFESIRI